ncbi:acetyl-CoA carboxylase carboxyltransferase subunit alpha [bacterium]|nr:acetyl-CoA carboxylase carboxyltransferase subunit alpha [bacterium]
MAGTALDFERPLIELEKKIEALKKSSESSGIDLSSQIVTLQRQLDSQRLKLYSKLTPWQRVQLARHPRRPYMLDLVRLITRSFTELHGDRLFGDDKAIVGGFAVIDEVKVMLVGHQKGRDTKENIMRNFGCPHPEGYRKALRLMKMAEKFKLPVISLIDTPGAYPGIGAEERGQARAIALNLREMMQLRTPMIIVITGEGCSGGALGVGIGDIVAMFQNAYYSVISPEGCAAILWKDAGKMELAAKALKLTANDLAEHKLIDDIIPEPIGGAHTNHAEMGTILKERLLSYLEKLKRIALDELLEKRYKKFRAMGVFTEPAPEEKRVPSPREEEAVPHLPEVSPLETKR